MSALIPPPGPSGLRLVVLDGPRRDHAPLQTQMRNLARRLMDAGHEVDVLSWAHRVGRTTLPTPAAIRTADAVLAALPRRAGEMVALQVALRLVGGRQAGPRVVLLADRLPDPGAAPWRLAPVAWLLARADILIVPDAAAAARATRLGATSVRIGVGLQAIWDVESPVHPAPEQDLPLEAVEPVAVLTGREYGRKVQQWAGARGMAKGSDPASAWAAAGVIFAIDLVDELAAAHVAVMSESRRCLARRWGRGLGREVVALPREPEDATVGVLGRVYPDGCTAGNVQDTLQLARRVLMPGGVVVLTVPLGAGEVGGCDVAGLHALEAWADDCGLALVGDLSRALPRASALREADGVYGLVRLTFRRR
ncbi:hypothetical protein [Gephyromycinifex aptenodytis]|uniref:hypothetical protein n=1 Tax=Gephyromycinifex aptenodytis TaxID=2716227 RepID=UPI001444A6C9|nr:hypothetical protein [Gephyromycinifex aptenodytis]